jgi:hypothetical protein
MSDEKKTIESMDQVWDFLSAKGIQNGMLTDEQALAVCRASSNVDVKIKKPSVVGTKMYKDNLLIEITGDHRPFSFGAGKAKLIVDNFDAIKEVYETQLLK